MLEFEPVWKGPNSIYKFDFEKVTETFVFKEINSLGCKSKGDVIGMDSKLLHLSAQVIVKYVTFLINKSLSCGLVPKDWKKARVTPLYNCKGVKSNYNSYRPISVICHLAKVMEKCVHSQFGKYLDKHNFLTPHQSAYLKFHSTQTSLVNVTDNWYQNIEDGLITGVCFFDISKCFDAICHDTLLFKLKKYGILGHSLKWFKSYLTDRSQALILNKSLTSFKNVTTGIPQGSILGPVLFLIFMNDLPMFVKNCNLYADDTMLD